MDILNQKVTLLSKIPLTPRVLWLRFQLSEPLLFQAGQFIKLEWDINGQHVARNYSIASPPYQGMTTFSLVATLLANGVASTQFQFAQPGWQTSLKGPYGRLLLPKAVECPSQLILVATGTGIAPFYAMLPDLEEYLKCGCHVDLFFGVRNSEELFFFYPFKVLAEQYSHFNFTVCFSRQQTTESACLHSGYVQQYLVNIDVHPNALVMLCGHPDMVDGCFTLFTKDKGLKASQIKREKYILNH
ncbi:FAD-binding oxidoreductase [Zooshikella ganghwensis]|uniref:FAD-binding oxidoreductase n=1 Tax=Zooshikella ganghwensis TaxID=202772 RepID=UPI00048523C5|nr:FAD-binding oxidoreductase [Zooshikella ganghwensis]